MKLVIDNLAPHTIDDVQSIKIGIEAVVMKYPEKYRNKIRLGVQELVMNAIEHGVIGLGSKKKYELKRQKENAYKKYLNEQLKKHIQCRITVGYVERETTIKLVVSDHGNGFDWKKVSNNKRCGFYVDSMGIVISKDNFDELSYNECGNVVTAVVYKK
jgi:anti-sigma regulatory factor (Ser/Thr protein kinase)